MDPTLLPTKSWASGVCSDNFLSAFNNTVVVSLLALFFRDLRDPADVVSDDESVATVVASSFSESGATALSFLLRDDPRTLFPSTDLKLLVFLGFGCSTDEDESDASDVTSPNSWSLAANATLSTAVCVPLCTEVDKMSVILAFCLKRRDKSQIQAKSGF